MKKLLIILAMIFIGCSESGNSVAVLEFDPTDVENDSTEIDSIATIDSIDSIDTIDSVKEVKYTIINTNKNKEESSNSNEVTSSSSTKKDTVFVSNSSKVEDKSSSSINDNKEESSSSMENKNESSSSENVIVSSSSSSELVVSSSSENKVESSSSSKIVESSSSSKIVESSSSEEIVNSSSSKNEVVNSSSSVDEDYVDENEPKRELLSFVELDELKLNGFRVENSIAYLSWENNTDYTMQINVEYYIGCSDEVVGVSVDSTIMYTIKANSVKEKAIYEIKNDAKKCVGEIKTITATENDKSNFAGWKMPNEIKGRISFRN